MTGRKSFAASAGITSPVAAIVIVIIVCGSAFGIVELQLSSTDSGRSTVTATVTTTLISISTTTIVSSTHLTQGGVAQVAVTATALKAADFLAAGTSTGFTCGAADGSYLTLTNSGTAQATVTSMTLVVAGVSNTFALTAGSCTVAAVGAAANNPQSLLFVAVLSHTTVNAVAGNAFTGTVTLNNGAVLLFAGTFQ